MDMHAFWDMGPEEHIEVQRHDPDPAVSVAPFSLRLGGGAINGVKVYMQRESLEKIADGIQAALQDADLEEIDQRRGAQALATVSA